VVFFGTSTNPVFNSFYDMLNIWDIELFSFAYLTFLFVVAAGPGVSQSPVSNP
jgi:hypothetical protein